MVVVVLKIETNDSRTVYFNMNNQTRSFLYYLLKQVFRHVMTVGNFKSYNIYYLPNFDIRFILKYLTLFSQTLKKLKEKKYIIFPTLLVIAVIIW